MNVKDIISWLLRIAIAIIFIQTLYFKFTAHPESVYIFSQMGIEPVGRIVLGIFELLASALILFPATLIIGLILSFGIISGAIFSHLLILGLEINGDNGGLFYLAVIVLVLCILLILIHYNKVIKYLKEVAFKLHLSKK